MKTIRETENYRVIERHGTYKLQYNANGCWRIYGEYKQQKAAIRNLERLESYRK